MSIFLFFEERINITHFFLDFPLFNLTTEQVFIFLFKDKNQLYTLHTRYM